MVVEIAKESSDMFLPLKAVVGAMTALMKNYDVGGSYSWAKHTLIIDVSLVSANIR